jgi:hypothetical protein
MDRLHGPGSNGGSRTPRRSLNSVHRNAGCCPGRPRVLGASDNAAMKRSPAEIAGIIADLRWPISDQRLPKG